MKYEYKIVDETAPTSLENRVNEYAAQGYRVTHFNTRTRLTAGSNAWPSFCAVMERAVPDGPETTDQTSPEQPIEA